MNIFHHKQVQFEKKSDDPITQNFGACRHKPIIPIYFDKIHTGVDFILKEVSVLVKQ